MKKSYLERQTINVKENYNYFTVKLITSILKILSKLAIVLLLGSIFNNIYLTIFEIIFTIYSLYNINYVVNYYSDIMKDIKNTVKFENNYFELDLNLIHNDIFSRVTK